MKKVVSIIISIMAFFVIYFLQINFFSWFNISGVRPNLFIVLAIFIGVFMDKKYAIAMGLLFGILIDVLTSSQMGISGVALSCVGFLCGYVDKFFSKNSRMTIIIMVACSTLAYELLTYTYKMISLGIPFEVGGFFRIIFIELIFNSLITIILYPAMQWIGGKTEAVFSVRKSQLPDYVFKI